MENKKIAVIRIRGLTKLKGDIEDTMKMLNLYRKYSCVILDNNIGMIGMITKIKDYVTWGEIDEETFKLLIEKRGKIYGNKQLSEDYMKNNIKLSYEQFVKEFFSNNKKLRDVPGLKTYFRLKPPTGGFERHGIKKHYSMGGAVGYRKEKINDLIKKMI